MKISTRRRGFTIPEMLAVIAIIVIIISMLLPALGGGRKAAWVAQCASNQHQIRIAMQGNKVLDGYNSMPSAGAWVYFARKKSSAEIFNCPAAADYDKDSGPKTSNSFDQVYSVQTYGGDHTATFSWVTDILNGDLSGDNQLGRIYQGQYTGDFGESGQTWVEAAYGNMLQPHELGVSYNNDGGYVVEMELDGNNNIDDAWIHSLDAPGKTGIGSNHWVCMGEGGGSWRGEIVMQLTGGAHAEVDPSVKIGAGSSQYGMNNLVSSTSNRGGQFLLMDYGKTIVRMNTNGTYLDDFDEYFAPRHFDKANVTRVDASVSLMSRGEMNNNDAWKPTLD